MLRGRLRRPAREILLVAGLYGLYTLVRNMLGDQQALAERNAWRIIDLERRLGIFHELGIQLALTHDGFMEVLNAFYGIAHFLVTGAVLIWLYLRRSTYAWWRTAIVATTFLALIGYATFPLMPPRLLPELGIVDTLAVHGSPWNYEHGPMSDLSNQFAAMPSLHVAWALWCACALWVEGAAGRSPSLPFRTAAIFHAVATVVAVVATGNHFILDAVGGALVLAAGFAIAQLARRWRRRRDAPAAPDASEAVVPAVDGDDVGGVVAARTAREVHGDPGEVVA